MLTTGRQLEHWHTGAMTRRCVVLDALEPDAIASLSGDPLTITTRRGTITLAARGDPKIPEFKYATCRLTRSGT